MSSFVIPPLPHTLIQAKSSVKLTSSKCLSFLDVAIFVSGGLFNRHPAFISVQTVLLISSTSSFIDKIRKLYFDSAHNKTVQHKLYRAFNRIYINNKTTRPEQLHT
jgi:hypothetical protein